MSSLHAGLQGQHGKESFNVPTSKGQGQCPPGAKLWQSTDRKRGPAPNARAISTSVIVRLIGKLWQKREEFLQDVLAVHCEHGPLARVEPVT